MMMRSKVYLCDLVRTNMCNSIIFPTITPEHQPHRYHEQIPNKNPGGSIVNMSSILGQCGIPKGSDYNVRRLV
jgi:NAD(P)-dependent dehydrogenase (short-subunit alcohol dehydrogenase family)